MLDSYVGITKIISRIQKNHNGGGGRIICGNSPETVVSVSRDFAFKKKSPILPIIYETKRGIKIRNKNYSFFMYKQSKRTPFRV